MPSDYSDFRVLIDDAAVSPQLGFQAYATALSDIIRGSTPEFAVGIFGSWGTGKTTLMRQIERGLDNDPTVVTAWFTAWRYEREPHLIVPMIDVLREALDERAEKEPPAGAARQAAGKLRRAGRAFLAGLTLSAKVPGVELQLDPGKVMQELQSGPDPGREALSFYHAAFLMLREAIEDFSAGGTRRVVVFVDDLDRCLPTNALDVLESMKLFFDVQGCVFVVGLDQAIAERAVAQKYALGDSSAAEQSPVSGVDYLKKIFQVPFALPRVGTIQLREYCRAMLHSGGLAQAQIADFNDNVSPHLDFLSEQDAVNPREIKRLVNAYVLQVKMLGLRLGPTMNPRIVLALQIMNFRPDWRDFYEELAADPTVFQRTLSDAVAAEEPQGQVWLAGRSFAVPPRMMTYFRGPAADLLLDPQLISYVSAAESSRSTDPMLLDAQASLNRLRGVVEAWGEESSADALRDLPFLVSRLSELFHRRSDQPRLVHAARELEMLTKELSDPTTVSAERRSEQLGRLKVLIGEVESELRELRRQSNLGAYS